MKLIKPSFEIKEQEDGYNRLLKHIEWAGRHCYKSLDKTTEESASKFVEMLINRGHTAMVEHGTVYLRFKFKEFQFEKYIINPFSYVTIDEVDSDRCVTTNYRVLLLNGWLDDLQYQCEPTEHHIKRITVKFICDRGILAEFTRHRIFSFAAESTRYCNYSKDKFNNCITYILPNWCTNVNIEDYEKNPKLMYNANGELTDNEINFLCGLYDIEGRYLKMIENGWIAQQARAILPNALKTELIMTGTIEQWEYFFKLRCANDAHPQASELAIPLRNEFIKRGYIKLNN